MLKYPAAENFHPVRFAHFSLPKFLLYTYPFTKSFVRAENNFCHSPCFIYSNYSFFTTTLKALALTLILLAYTLKLIASFGAIKLVHLPLNFQQSRAK